MCKILYVLLLNLYTQQSCYDWRLCGVANKGGCDELYEGSKQDEKACIISLKTRKISVLEPAIFLAGISAANSSLAVVRTKGPKNN